MTDQIGRNKLAGKTALVTGATGFVGSFLIPRLIKEGLKVRILLRKTSDLSGLKDLPVELAYGDITEPETLSPAVIGVDYLFHLAVIKFAHAEVEYDKINYQGTKYLLDACLRYRPALTRFFYMSAQAVVGPSSRTKPVNENSACSPITFYGSSKLKGELEAIKYSTSLPVTVIRPPMVYGPKKKSWFFLFKSAKHHFHVCFGFKEKLISLCYIDDLIDGVWLACQKEGGSGQIYFIADKQIYSDRIINHEISQALRLRSVNLIVPDSLTLVRGKTKDLIVRLKGGPATSYYFQKAKETVAGAWLCDPSKAERELGFIAKTPLKDGIKKSVDWYRANGWL